jgi:hypothetical protein
MSLMIGVEVLHLLQAAELSQLGNELLVVHGLMGSWCFS